jgi:hypothetical protein
MTRTNAVIAIATLIPLAWAGAAQGQMSIHPKNGADLGGMDHKQGQFLQQLAKDFPLPPAFGADRKPVKTVTIGKHDYNPPIVIGFDGGGELTRYEDRWSKIAAAGSKVAITSACQSACTLVTAYLAKENICFGEFAWLGFHQATYTENGKPALFATQWMFDRYPLEIQAWIEGKGGVEDMPHSGTRFWTLPAKTLWRMGYKRCD